MSRRWPIGDLLDATGLTMNGLCKTTGGNPYDYVETGLSDLMADRWAIRCGIHPVMAWPDWFDAGLSELDREFLANGWRPAWLWNETDISPGVAA